MVVVIKMFTIAQSTGTQYTSRWKGEQMFTFFPPFSSPPFMHMSHNPTTNCTQKTWQLCNIFWGNIKNDVWGRMFDRPHMSLLLWLLGKKRSSTCVCHCVIDHQSRDKNFAITTHKERIFFFLKSWFDETPSHLLLPRDWAVTKW